MNRSTMLLLVSCAVFVLVYSGCDKGGRGPPQMAKQGDINTDGFVPPTVIPGGQLPGDQHLFSRIIGPRAGDSTDC
jgi:hypothetical protein